MVFLAPPPFIAPALQSFATLSFSGFRAGMPLSEARARIKAAGGALACKPTLDWRMRDCTGSFPFGDLPAGFEVLISSINDSSAVIVLSTRNPRSVAASWVSNLTENLGRPNHTKTGGLATWQWVRAARMLRVVERKSAGRWETSVTFTHGPLLDGLGPIQRKRPG